MSLISDAIGTVIGPGRLYAELAVAGVLIAGVGAQTWRLHSAETGEAKAIATHATYVASAASAALAASEKNRAIEAQRTQDVKEAANEAQRMSIHARDDGAAVGTALDRLYQRTAAAAGGGQAASHSVAAAGSSPAQGDGLRADVLRSVGDEARRYAGIADDARIAGLACERSYDALTR